MTAASQNFLLTIPSLVAILPGICYVSFSFCARFTLEQYYSRLQSNFLLQFWVWHENCIPSPWNIETLFRKFEHLKKRDPHFEKLSLRFPINVFNLFNLGGNSSINVGIIKNKHSFIRFETKKVKILWTIYTLEFSSWRIVTRSLFCGCFEIVFLLRNGHVTENP